MFTHIVYFLIIVAVFFTGYRTGTSIQESEQAANEAYLREVYENKQSDIIRASNDTINLLKAELSAKTDANNSMQSTIDRLQFNLKQSTDRLTKATNSCDTERALLRKCQGLLGEGTQLLKEGTDLLRATAINNDALVTLHSNFPIIEKKESTKETTNEH